MQALARALGNPHEYFKSVLIAGTNGKGSVASFLSGMIPDAGVYTSPHLVRLNERIRIGNQEISDPELKRVFEQVRITAARTEDLLYPPTYFEIVTAMAFCYFRDRVKFAVLEVGLGGRLDATNIVAQEVSVITSIGLDHQQFLGSTIEEIAGEKAGIIKSGEPVVVGPTAELRPVLDRAGDRIIRAGNLARNIRHRQHGLFEFDVQTPLREYRALKPRLPGRHQIENAVVAIRAAESLNLAPERIETGINNAAWPGRLEKIDGTPNFILDGAHNIDAVRRLAAFLSEFHPEGVWVIFGAMADKQVFDMISLLKPHAREMIFTKAQSSRSKDPEAMRQFFSGSRAEPTVHAAIAYARAHAPLGMPVLVCGSLYLIGEARSLLR
jgi:dihydrofolate synthase/folylpolyglutamate synthase